MVINEKALVKAMKAAYKGDGYVVGCPRKALGLIAEHLGKIILTV